MLAVPSLPALWNSLFEALFSADKLVRDQYAAWGKVVKEIGLEKE